jgi:hypothetical protein
METVTYHISEAKNLIVIARDNDLIIAVKNPDSNEFDVYMTDNPAFEPRIGERKRIDFDSGKPIKDIIDRILQA